MSEIRTWVRKVSGPLARVATSSPDGCKDIYPIHADTGTARVTAGRRWSSGPQREGVGTVSGTRWVRRAAFADGYRLPVGGV